MLLDGREPFADAAAQVGLACRLCLTEDGLQGAPAISS